MGQNQGARMSDLNRKRTRRAVAMRHRYLPSYAPRHSECKVQTRCDGHSVQRRGVPGWRTRATLARCLIL